MGISNDLTFIDGLDPRVKSSLSEEELIFPPYNALQIQEILRQRSKTAFKEGSLENGLIEKCAAYSAREHGDARRALELLRVAGEVAEREGETVVKIGHLDKAENKIEKDKVMDMVATQPKQFQAVLYAIVLVNEKGKNSIFTGEVYDVYRDVCSKTALRPLTQRRISDVIAEFDMFGIINIKVISKGRYGRTREISLSTPSSVIPKIKKLLEDDLSLN
jgi:cell division control protein 6